MSSVPAAGLKSCPRKAAQASLSQGGDGREEFSQLNQGRSDIMSVAYNLKRSHVCALGGCP